ncbi:glucokinase [Sphaeroforma arctica JP610]|uniref:Glucokinase n=1 Tax=Sphaeroforma arctica JP610 TaxID=667725 RepID=A0A0L0GCN9_9EUKA|nr:glucokinase [Sphaeroforma arctica JP610]KNC86777.1 glucokinase [Sphaeroforma arctica JP610]|eukprot:XP_014160679.1 glucokinase [Sphaeroforma arctica JP610]
MSDLIIVGDCGGTNTRLSLWEIPTSFTDKPKRTEKAPGTLVFDKKYLNEKHTDFVSVVKLFIEESSSSTTPMAACLACAGPIINNTGICNQE